jgi:hypothetical protein
MRELRLVRSMVGATETTLNRLTGLTGIGGTTGTAGTFCIERRREPLPKLGVLLKVFNVGVRGDSESIKLSLRGEGGEDEQTEVAAVITSPSDVWEVLVDALENRDVSFNGSSRKWSGESPVGFVVVVPLELILLDRSELDVSLSTGVMLGDSPVEDVAEGAIDRRLGS